jgi:hypothetical protein
MGRKPKLFLPLTVTFFDDDRIIEAGDTPTLLYIAMCLRCKAMGTDGRLTETQIARLNRPRWRSELRKLAELELVVWDEVYQEWAVSAWLGHNESLADLDAKREADRIRKRDSARNPGGFPPDSAPKGSRGKGREGKEGNPRGTHRFVDDGAGSCETCSLLPANDIHLRVVDGRAS